MFVTYYLQFSASVLWTVCVIYSVSAYLDISVEIVMLQICNIGSAVVTMDIGLTEIGDIAGLLLGEGGDCSTPTWIANPTLKPSPNPNTSPNPNPTYPTNPNPKTWP